MFHSEVNWYAVTTSPGMRRWWLNSCGRNKLSAFCRFVKRSPNGILIEKKGVYKFILSVDLIQQAVACEIDACDVVKIG